MSISAPALLVGHLRPDGRRGFTLVELLTILAIIGLLMSLVLPAVMDARAAARRMSCANNLRQIGTALTQFESTHGHFPGIYAGSTGPWFGLPKQEWSYSPSSLLAAELSGPSLAALVPITQPLNEPFNPDWNGIDLPSPAVLRCPDDPYATGRASSYRFCRGVLPLWPKDPGGVFISNQATRAAEITDGLSTTAFASERLVSMPRAGSPDRRRDLVVFDPQATPNLAAACVVANQGGTAVPLEWSREPAGDCWISGRWLHNSYYHLFPPNSLWFDCRQTGTVAMAVTSARSYHPGGVNALFGDGHVRFIHDSINLDLWWAQATRAGQELAQGE